MEAAKGEPRALDAGNDAAADGGDDGDSAAVKAMLRAVAASRLPVCSQQQGEPELTEREKVAILGRLYREKPLVFLERFRTGLREEHLACFGHLRGDHRADFYCAEVARQGAARPRALHTRLRNRRYAALRELIQGAPAARGAEPGREAGPGGKVRLGGEAEPEEAGLVGRRSQTRGAQETRFQTASGKPAILPDGVWGII